MRFRPPFCPLPDCPSRRGTVPFRCHRKGFYLRSCDGRSVQRFLCLACRRRFSTQAFRLDYRLKLPSLSRRVFPFFVSKVTHRQTARILRVSRRTVAHRLLLLGRHCRDFHESCLRGNRLRGGLRGTFQLDELETYETDRRLFPVTVPVLIERDSFFVVHAETAPIPARGGLRPRDVERKKAAEVRYGRRRSGSRESVERSFAALRRALDPGFSPDIQTDRKTSYIGIVRRQIPRFASHSRIHSSEVRNTKNLLFPINLTLAMLRDGVSRLVRRSWGASKLRRRLEDHLWIWIAWRNYVRGITVTRTEVTPAMQMRVVGTKLSSASLLRWRVFS